MSLRILFAVTAGVALLACSEGGTQSPPESSAPAPEAPPLAAPDGSRIRAADTEPGNWLAHGRTYSEQRFSPLAQIDKSNVRELGLAWSFDLGSTRGVEATPIVVDGVMYVTASWSLVFALDAGTGELALEVRPAGPR